MRDVRPITATCPECRGPLSEVTEDGVREYRCLVEHRYAHSETQERTLWAAVLVLEEAALLARETAAHLPAASDTLLRQATEKEKQADVVRAVVETLKPFTME
jgi:hypothetical protein